MSNCIEKEFNCFGCLKGHYIGIKLEGETKIKIVPFSPLIIMYTDGSVEKADFDRLDLVYWRKKADEAYARKMRMDINTHCFVCDDTFNTISKLENHLKDQLHL